METVVFSDGEYEITHYHVTETDHPCLNFIGLGNKDIGKANTENVYAMIAVSGDSCGNELSELTYRKLVMVVN